MPDVRPFAGLLYDPAVAGALDAVTAPPYDIISPIDQDRYYRASPYNVVRLILGRSEPRDDAAHNRYSRAAAYLRAWRDEGVLRLSDHAAFFPYELRFHDSGRERTLRGVIAEVGLEPWGGSIIPHERTMPGPLEDRLRLLRAVEANLSAVYAVAGGPQSALSTLLDGAMAGAPAVDVTDRTGTRHRLWVAPEDPGLTGHVTESLRQDTLLIADGHHRYTVALAYQEEMRARFGPGPWDAVMMLIVDGATEDPPVLPIHRVARGPIPPEPDPGERVRDLAEVLASLADDQVTYGTVRLEDGEAIHRVARLGGGPPTVCALHEQVLDPAIDLALQFVPDAVQAEAAVLTGAASIAFLLPPTRVERVRAVVRQGQMLPQKSTYFWPKPRTGMVLRPLDADSGDLPGS